MLDKLTETEAESARLSRRNVELASELLGLAQETDRGKSEPMNDPATKLELERVEQEARTSRQRWRVMKGTASAIVAGSGVDWARDHALRDIVLDPE